MKRTLFTIIAVFAVFATAGSANAFTNTFSQSEQFNEFRSYVANDLADAAFAMNPPMPGEYEVYRHHFDAKLYQAELAAYDVLEEAKKFYLTQLNKSTAELRQEANSELREKIQQAKVDFGRRAKPINKIHKRLKAQVRKKFKGKPRRRELRKLNRKRVGAIRKLKRTRAHEIKAARASHTAKINLIESAADRQLTELETEGELGRIERENTGLLERFSSLGEEFLDMIQSRS